MRTPVIAHLLTFALFVSSLHVAPPIPPGDLPSVRYIDPTFDVVVHTDVSYGSVLNLSTMQVEDLMLDIYEPADDSAETRAVVFWVHGGSFTEGDKREMEEYCRYFAERGYVAIAPNYRLVDVLDRQALGSAYASSDVQAAVRWAHGQASTWRFDHRRISLCGNSSGGFAALGAAYDQALKVHNLNHFAESMEIASCSVSSGRLYNLTSLESGEPPVFIAHGVLDERVPFSFAMDLEDQATSQAVVNETMYFPMEGHALLLAQSDVILPGIRDFLFAQVIKE
jgi:dienelactone hydrolase